MINLYVNSEFNGLKLMVEQIDESFLRKNKRMPNDIYKGDNMGSKKVLGVKFDLFEVPSVWKKAAYNNHYPKNSKKPLDKLLFDKDQSILDLPSFAKFSLYLDLLNTYHFDDTHNWIFYYDNYYEKMFPIVWDPLGWHGTWEKRDSVNIVSSFFLRELYSNYKFLYLKYQAAFDFIEIKSNFIKTIDQEIDLLKTKLDTDGYTFALSYVPMDYSRTLKQLKIFRAKIVQRLDRVEDYFMGDINTSDYIYALNKNSINLSINGSKMVNKIIIQAENLAQLKNISASYRVNGKKVTKNLNYKISSDNKNIIMTQNLLATIKFSYIDGTAWYYGSFDAATYNLELQGLDNEDIKKVSLVFLNKNQQQILLSRQAQVQPSEFKDVVHIIEEKPNTSILNWSGTKIFSGFNIIKQDIVIEPGTKLIFNENSSLKILGKVTALGTKDQPIRFQAKDK
jgi:hypothetical protein